MSCVKILAESSREKFKEIGINKRRAATYLVKVHACPNPVRLSVLSDIIFRFNTVSVQSLMKFYAHHTPFSILAGRVDPSQCRKALGQRSPRCPRPTGVRLGVQGKLVSG